MADVDKVIKDLQGNFGGSNDEQMKGVQLVKGLATSDEPKANEFMKKLDTATTKISKEVLDNKKKESYKEVKDFNELVKPYLNSNNIEGLAMDLSDSLINSFSLKLDYESYTDFLKTFIKLLSTSNRDFVYNDKAERIAMEEKILSKDTLIEGKIFKKGVKYKVVEDKEKV